jgi:hypothetical protein
MRTNDSEFLLALLGKPVRIIAVDEHCLPPMPSMVLKEVSSLGVVVADSRTSRFFPWHEIVEIHPVGATDEQEAALEEGGDALLGVDSEP